MNKNGFNIIIMKSYIPVVLRKEGVILGPCLYECSFFFYQVLWHYPCCFPASHARERLRYYGQYLYSSGGKPNTVSRICVCFVASIIEGVESGRAHVHRLFHDVYAGVDISESVACRRT